MNKVHVGFFVYLFVFKETKSFVVEQYMKLKLLSPICFWINHGLKPQVWHFSHHYLVR